MKHIVFDFDFISPYAFLAFERLPQVLQGLSYRVSYRPLLFAALLQQKGQLGPAEIPGKREWTYRQILWLAHQQGVPLQMPALHPFNPLPLLRLAVACSDDGLPNRYVCETIFRHVWQGGQDATDATRLASLRSALSPRRDPDGPEVKDILRGHTEAALARGVFGVPSFEVDERLFWGFDALPMLRGWLEGDPWFASGAWEGAAQTAVGVQRPR